MSPSKRFLGFEDVVKDSAITMSEFPAQAYLELERGFSADALKAQGVIVERREDIALKEAKGFIIVARQPSAKGDTRKWALVAVAGDLTALITAQSPDSAKDTYSDEAFHAAFASFVVRATVPSSEQLAILPYAMTELSGFRPLRTASDGAALLTDGPHDVAPIAEQSYILMMVPVGEMPSPDQRGKLARQYLADTPGVKDIHIIRAEPMRIGNSQGFEILAEGKEVRSNNDVMLAQWLQFGSSSTSANAGPRPPRCMGQNLSPTARHT
jgi:hypothetical protein